LNPIQRAGELLATWADQVDQDHAQPGSVDAMRQLAAEVLAEYFRLARSPGAALDALIKAWAARELGRLPRDPWDEWIRTGEVPEVLKAELAGLPEPVAALIGAHLADEISQCECCRRRAPCRLISDGTDSGESDWRCAWGCPAPPDVEPVVEWARGGQ
jgi:hypothetical protein